MCCWTDDDEDDDDVFEARLTDSITSYALVSFLLWFQSIKIMQNKIDKLTIKLCKEK